MTGSRRLWWRAVIGTERNSAFPPIFRTISFLFIGGNVAPDRRWKDAVFGGLSAYVSRRLVRLSALAFIRREFRNHFHQFSGQVWGNEFRTCADGNKMGFRGTVPWSVILEGVICGYSAPLWSSTFGLTGRQKHDFHAQNGTSGLL